MRTLQSEARRLIRERGLETPGADRLAAALTRVLRVSGALSPRKPRRLRGPRRLPCSTNPS